MITKEVMEGFKMFASVHFEEGGREYYEKDHCRAVEDVSLWLHT